jgi:hypothetical protein
LIPQAPDNLPRRRHLLLTMLTVLACRYPPGVEPLVITGVRRLLAGWPGLGRITAGMARQEYDLQLKRYGQEGWRATFYPAGIGHSLTPMVESA